ncbi:ATP-binding protein [Streptomyces sp. NPDC048606]|uniref:ATP-binding protein n=1 Tax=Streptomyces sp. NPDC048606 TaxID=3154726 RepID=UPI0034441E56
MNSQIGYFENQFVAVLPATPRAARQARRLAVEQCLAWGLPTEGVALVVGELAANAVTHGRVPGRGFQVALIRGERALRVEVTDTRRDRIPEPRDADPGAEGGRGLALVVAVADRWGVEAGPPPRKVVWAEWDVPGEGLAP